MRELKEIEKEIEGLSRKLNEVTGTPTEVYTRIVGYYRSVKNWNRGKKEEFGLRKLFLLPEEGNHPSPSRATEFSSYRFFYKNSCPNCPPVKRLLSKQLLPGVEVCVDSPEGLAEAEERGIYAAPTVVILNSQGREIYRSSNLKDLEEIMLKETNLALAAR